MRADEAHQQELERHQLNWDEFTVTVDGRKYRCVTTGWGSDFLVEACYDEQDRETECGQDIYEAAFNEHIERSLP